MTQQSITVYNFKLSFEELLFFVFLWILIYFEPTTIGAFKVSQLWKTIVLVGLFFHVISRKKLPFFVCVGIWFSLKYLVYTHMPYGYTKAIQDALEALIFPLFLAFFYLKYRNRPDSTDRLIHISLLLSLFMIFSAVPFWFGLGSLNPVRGLEAFGLERNAMTGLFYSVAGSSKMFVISTIVLITAYGRFRKRFLSRAIWVTAVLLGTYFVYASWTRTGWALFLVALVVNFYYGAKIKRKVVVSILTVLLVMGVLWLYDTSQAFRWRLVGGATYRQNVEMSFDQVAKARIPFIVVAIDNLKDEGSLGQLLGYGTKRGIDLYEQKTRMSIVSHNRTFEILESSGVIALILYLTFVCNLFYNVFRNMKYASMEIKRLTIVSAFLFAGFYFSSHGTPFWGEIIFAPIFISVFLLKDGGNPSALQLNVKETFNG